MISGVEDKDNILSLHVEYPIKGFDWILEFLFRQGTYDDNEIASIINVVSPLLEIKDRKKLSTLFDLSMVNSVLTASDKKTKRSVMILTRVTSMGQFVNSLVHEALHLSRHVDECGNNEELFTVLGDICGDIVKRLYLL